MANKTKLELTWIGKDQRPRLEPRILLEDTEKSYHAKQRFSASDHFDNKLIFGDNLLALKALEQEYSGKVKCIFIDPPYNTGSAFEHYDDGLEHSVWLSLMKDRIELIHKLLSDDGSLWISIDDNECHYLKILCDEVFSRSNFVANVIWQKKYAVANDHKTIAPMHDHILVYQKSENWKRNLLPRPQGKDKQYKFEDARGVYRTSDYTCSKTIEERPNLYYAITQPNTGAEIFPSKTRVWAYSQKVHRQHVEDDMIYWGKEGKGKTPSFKRYRHLLKQDGIVPQTIWSFDFAGHTDIARKEVRAIFETKSVKDDFLTPKPEKLIQQILTVATKESDLVLDSFAGSGTTGAVAHKMGRKWIMIELGKHCDTHIIPRMKKVVDGDDSGGATESNNWKGGGGFRYFTLAPSLLEKDKFDNWIISKEYNKEMLVEALCKLEGFEYAPSDSAYWQHGHSTENDFIYVTTQTLTKEQIQKLSDEVGPKRSLLICCGAYRVRNLEEYANLTLKKIPRAVMAKCEWGKDDYSLEIKNLTPPPEPEPDLEIDEKPKAKRRRSKPSQGQMGLFEVGGAE